MSELQNPLFDEEKEFLERKKLEYERALRGDVDHLKDQSVRVGKMALVGAGLAGGVWLITKALSGRKHKRNPYSQTGADREADDDEGRDDDGSGAGYFTAGNGKRYRSTVAHKSAADSARVFLRHHDQEHEADDLGFGSKAASPADERPAPHPAASLFNTGEFEDDPFQDLPYDDSRRLPASHAFDAEPEEGDAVPAAGWAGSRSRMVGAVLQSFLQSDTGKVLVAQVAAVALAVVTKKVSEFFPPAKNADLATSPGYATASAGASPVAALSSPTFPDASTRPQPL